MPNNNKLNNWSLTILRIVLGVIFTYHGYTKLFVAGGFSGTVGFFTAIKIPLPIFSALLVSVVEFAGGLLLLAGLLVRLASVALIIEMLVAFFKVHLKMGFMITQTAYGYEFILLILASLIVVLVNGAGKLTIKEIFKGKGKNE